MTKRLKPDTRKKLPHGNASQVGGYPGTSGRMLSEWAGGCSGIRNCPPHPTWLPPEEWLGAPVARKWPLHLISNQPRTKLHSQLDLGAHSRADKVQGREVVRLAPEDARARGLADGDVVRLRNERGACIAVLRVSDDVFPGVAQLSTGAWFDPSAADEGERIEKHGNPNVLTRDIGSSRLAQGVAAMSCLVEIEPFTGPLPEITVFQQPRKSSKNMKESG